MGDFFLIGVEERRIIEFLSQYYEFWIDGFNPKYA